MASHRKPSEMRPIFSDSNSSVVSVDSSNSSSIPPPYHVSADGTRFFRFACKARNVGQDHNAHTAYLLVPEDAQHGYFVRCSHRACLSTGRQFRYCIVCRRAVTRRNFHHRHDHGIIRYTEYGRPILPPCSSSAESKRTAAAAGSTATLRRTGSSTSVVSSSSSRGPMTSLKSTAHLLPDLSSLSSRESRHNMIPATQPETTPCNSADAPSLQGDSTEDMRMGSKPTTGSTTTTESVKCNITAGEDHEMKGYKGNQNKKSLASTRCTNDDYHLPTNSDRQLIWLKHDEGRRGGTAVSPVPASGGIGTTATSRWIASLLGTTKRPSPATITSSSSIAPAPSSQQGVAGAFSHQQWMKSLLGTTRPSPGTNTSSSPRRSSQRVAGESSDMMDRAKDELFADLDAVLGDFDKDVDSYNGDWSLDPA